MRNRPRAFGAPRSHPAPAPFMINREYPITPTQQAANGALDLFVDSFRQNQIKPMLIGLSVLRSATEAQVLAAMTFVQASRNVTAAEIHAMLTA